MYHSLDESYVVLFLEIFYEQLVTFAVFRRSKIKSLPSLTYVLYVLLKPIQENSR